MALALSELVAVTCSLVYFTEFCTAISTTPFIYVYPRDVFDFNQRVTPFC